MTHWIMLKSGQLQVQERKPRNRAFVEETTVEIEWQHYAHTFKLFSPDGQVLRTEKFQSYCGQDRGPIREGRIKKLITSAVT